jgi:hypothetical protein
MRVIAQRLSAYEATGKKGSENSVVAGFAVCEKLRGPLARLSGMNGFRTLLLRALALAGAEIRWLRAVRVEADGTLEPCEEMEHLDETRIAAGGVLVSASLLALLATFIGEPLTLRLVRETWPEAPIDGIGSEEDSTEA